MVVANIGAMACDYWGIQQDAQTYYYYAILMSAFSYTYYCEVRARARVRVVNLLYTYYCEAAPTLALTPSPALA